MNKTEFGKIGESITCKYLFQNHYKIIDKNYYYSSREYFMGGHTIISDYPRYNCLWWGRKWIGFHRSKNKS